MSNAEQVCHAPEALAILRNNLGFVDEGLHRWVSFAIAENFKPVSAVPVNACPDCGQPARVGLGRFISHSTLMQLQECSCGVLWVNARVDADTSAWHFDRAYRDDAYYATDRAAVFDQLAGIVARETRRGGLVLDVGGAGGQLAAAVRTRRPDLAITVQDVSRAKVAEAATRGFLGIIGDDWMASEERYDAIILSDSIYYEPDLSALWDAVGRLRAPGGLIVLRVPNRVSVVRLVSWWQSRSKVLPVRLRGHNPDHLVICPRTYLERKLREIGCDQIQVLPSPVGEGQRVPGFYAAARAWHRMTDQCLTPSMVVVGRHSQLKNREDRERRSSR